MNFNKLDKATIENHLVSNDKYQILDDENTICLVKTETGYQTWVDGSLCLDDTLEDCIDWINEFIGHKDLSATDSSPHFSQEVGRASRH
jgi:hypothetical protein